MNRIVLIVASLLLCTPVLAEHHRGHAIGHLNEAVIKLNESAWWLSRLYICDEWTSLELLRIDTAISGAVLAIDQSVLAKTALIEGRLDNARRHINQPDMHGTPKSALKLSRQMVEYGSVVVRVNKCPENLAFARGIAFDRMAKAWHLLDLAAWHINDAIREEIYNDPEFICSGPNNHCE